MCGEWRHVAFLISGKRMPFHEDVPNKSLKKKILFLCSVLSCSSRPTHFSGKRHTGWAHVSNCLSNLDIKIAPDSARAPRLSYGFPLWRRGGLDRDSRWLVWHPPASVEAEWMVRIAAMLSSKIQV